jgi:ubiquinol-cytochrome c reductase cytochrome b subunit
MVNKLGAWLDERTGLGRPLRAFLDYPVPHYVHGNLLYSLGGLTLITFLLQAFSGILLVFYYDPSPVAAYDSVDYVTYQLPLGWLVRGLHHYGASALVILVVLHLLRTYFFSAYKKPRELNWLSGVLLLLATLGFGFTGYLLPWDQKGYWATKVGAEIAGSTPLIGPTLLALMQGGDQLGQLTLTRFYAIHVIVLPIMLGLLILFHIQQLRRHGVAPPITRRGQARADQFAPFFPNWVMTDTLLGLVLVTLLVYLSWSVRAPLEFPADPTSSDYAPRPEWYFLFLFQLLKYFPGPWEPVATVVIPLLAIGSLLALPFVDTSAERRPWRKPVATGIAILCILAIVVLTLLAR